MPRFRSLKNTLRTWLRRDEWSKDQPLPPECREEEVGPLSLANALFARLSQAESYGIRIEHRDIGKDAITKAR